MLRFVILTWTQEVQHRHIQAFKSSQKILRHSGPEVSRAVSNQQQLQSLPQLHLLVSPGEPPRWAPGMLLGWDQHWHHGLHLPHPTASSSQALFFPQIYHDVYLYFNFNLILLLSHQQAWIIYKASFLWGFFWTIQWYFLSCCSCVTATFPARPGSFSIPSPQTAVRACWCFQYSWRRECSCVCERAGRGRMGETRRRMRVEKGKKLPLQWVPCSAPLQQDKSSKVVSWQWSPVPHLPSPFHIHRAAFLSKYLTVVINMCIS